MEPASEKHARSLDSETTSLREVVVGALRDPAERVLGFIDLLADSSEKVRACIACELQKAFIIDEQRSVFIAERLLVETSEVVLQQLIPVFARTSLTAPERAAVVGVLLADPRATVRRAMLEALLQAPGGFGDLRGVLFLVSQRERSLELRELVEEIFERYFPGALKECEGRTRELLRSEVVRYNAQFPHEVLWPLMLLHDSLDVVERVLRLVREPLPASAGVLATGAYLFRLETGRDHEVQHFLGAQLLRSGPAINTVSMLLAEFLATTADEHVGNDLRALFIEQGAGAPRWLCEAAGVLSRSRRFSDRVVTALHLDTLAARCGVEGIAPIAERILGCEHSELLSAALSSLRRNMGLARQLLPSLAALALGDERLEPSLRAEALRLASDSLDAHSEVPKSQVERLALVLLGDIEEVVASQALSTLGALPALQPASRAAICEKLERGSEAFALTAAAALLHDRHLLSLTLEERCRVRAAALARAQQYPQLEEEFPELVVHRRTFLDLYLRTTPLRTAPLIVQRAAAGGLGIWCSIRAALRDEIPPRRSIR